MGPSWPSKTAFQFLLFFGVHFCWISGRVLGPKWHQNASENGCRKRAGAINEETRNRSTSQRFLLFLRPSLGPKRTQNSPTWVPKGLQKRHPKKSPKMTRERHPKGPPKPTQKMTPSDGRRSCDPSGAKLGPLGPQEGPQEGPKTPRRPPRGTQEGRRGPPRGPPETPEGPKRAPTRPKKPPSTVSIDRSIHRSIHRSIDR